MTDPKYNDTDHDQEKWDRIYQQSMDKYSLDVETTAEALREQELTHDMYQQLHDAVNLFASNPNKATDTIGPLIVSMVKAYRDYCARHDADMG